MGGKYDPIKPTKIGQSPHRYYNPNDYIQLTPRELEEQGDRVMEETKQNWKWREENIKAQEWRNTL